MPSVIDARLRRRTGALIPRPVGPWSGQLPEIADPERRAFAAQIAVLMDERKERIGEHAAGHSLPWAVNALGSVPGDQADRLEWQRRAASIGAWRELSGHDDPTDPIGPEPIGGDPDNRAAWHEALAALKPVDGPDVRGMTDGMLLHLRDTYPIETAWAPAWVADELRQVRAGAQEARLAAIRANAEAEAARRRREHEQASRQQSLAASYQAMHDAYRERETVFAAIMADRADWDRTTRQQRHLAVAADSELRQRHRDESYPPLRSAEPPPPTQTQRDELTFTVGKEIPQAGQWITDLAAQHRAFAEILASRHSQPVPAKDPGPAPSWAGACQDAILQPPKPQIQSSARILERITQHVLDMEAAE